MCPACNEPLVAFELEGVEIDRCLTCAGTWLDAGELEWLASRAGGPGGKLAEAVLRGAGPRHGERRCVRCPGKLQVVAVDGVEVDRCPRGHGLWFDRSELPKLMAGFSEGAEGAVARLLGELTASERRKEAT
jgi:Zn-finger nucleic acid-binding protein